MAPSGNDTAKIEILKGALYDSAQNHGSETRLFSQKDLVELDIVPINDPMLLMQVIQGLVNDKFFVPTSDNRGTLAWRWRSREDAKKYTSLPNEETIMVYSYIDEAGADGVWSRTIRNRLKMQESTLKSCIKYLETHGYITDMKNVEHPNKKMYIRANLRPSERATGGPWFHEGELDSAFIAELEKFVFEYIKNGSAYLSSHGSTGLKAPRKGVIRGGGGGGGLHGAALDVARGKKRAAEEMLDDQTHGHPTPSSRSHDSKKSFLPLPAGYMSYPSVAEVAQFIHDSGITNNTTLSEADVQQLVDVLTYDGLIEPIKVGSRKGYRVTRPWRQDPMPLNERIKRERAGTLLDQNWMGIEPANNGITEAPCGRCPVFDLCEEGGPVNPGNCVYFQRWLGLDQLDDATQTPGSSL